MKSLMKIFLMLILLVTYAISQEIVLNKKDAEVWSTSQVINGKLKGFFSNSGIIKINDLDINFDIQNSDSSFSIPVEIKEGLNKIVIEVSSILSDTLQLDLAYKIRPEIYAYAEINSLTATLKSEIIENPKNEQLSFFWKADENNPAVVSVTNQNEQIASIPFDNNFPEGEYYFDLLAVSNSNDTAKARTFLTFKKDSLKAFNIKTDHAAWIDSAIIYEITPYIYAVGGSNSDFAKITAKIPEIVRLGVNTIWIQPVYSTYYKGQGYDIIDYFNVRSDLGTEQELRTLVETAKSNGLRVMFDFVANHSSIQHPYAKNSAQYKTDSHYWNYYQREKDNAPYSQHYKFYQGFINYFWDDLPNLNYDNPEVQKWITEAAKYWVEKFDIDGYRFDAIWGVTARNPQFTKDLRLALKRIKPELLLLAEDKASQDQVFDERFDVAYDWTPEESWVSHWSWQTNYNPNGNQTIFNSPNENQKSNLLRSALTNGGKGFASNAKILRFTDNNDHYYFITHLGVERTKMVGALLFTLNGIPLLYNGQEIGKNGHPYNLNSIFLSGYPNDYYDPNKLFTYYQNLISIRKKYSALISDNYKEISVTPSNFVFGFRRWNDDQNLFTIMNMGTSSSNVDVKIPVEEINLDSSKIYYLTDLLSGEVISGTANELSQISISMERFSSRVYTLEDAPVIVNIQNEIVENVIPDKFELNQNYPNPFNPSTAITYQLSAQSKVELKIFDILGREVQTLVNEIQSAGQYKVNFNASNLTSGIYIYQIKADNFVQSKKMMLLK